MGMKKITVGPRQLIYWQIIINLLVKFPAQIVPTLGVLEYSVDLINVILLFYLILRIVQRNKYQHKCSCAVPTFMIIAILLFDIARAIFEGTNILLFLWGVRNQYRFLLLFLAVCEFWSIDDIKHFLQICYRILIFNMFVVTVQLIIGYKGDYLGGTFGLEKNVNAMTNIFLCIMVTYGILGNMYKKVSLKCTLIILLISVYWAAMAEIKLFFVEFVIIFAVLFFVVKGKAMSKLKWTFSMIVFLGAGVVALGIAFPEQVEYVTNISRLLWYARNVKGGAYGFGMFTALGMITNIFFDNDLISKLIGIGVGNAEFMDISGTLIASPFYNQYHDYMYMGYFHSMIYIERGVLGLVWYAFFWLLSFGKSIRMKKKSNYHMMAEFSIPLLICIVMLAIKDSTLRISVSGYLVSIIMALPYLKGKTSSK